MAENLEHLIYSSIATSSLDAGDVFKIVEKSSQNNTTREVTGVLIHVKGHFFQAIEGPRGGLDELLGVLRKDPRHNSIKILLRKPIAQRRFPNWRMHRMQVDDTIQAAATFKRLLTEHGDTGDILARFEEYLSQHLTSAV